MADEKTSTGKAAGIRAKLNAIAPWPATGDATAPVLARYYAASAMKHWARQMAWPPPREVAEGLYVAQVAAMCADFSAAVALAALADPLSPPLWGREGFGATSPAELAGAAATQIRDLLEDGGGIGEWLWEFLGKETCEEITGLVEELEAARAAPEPKKASSAEAPAVPEWRAQLGPRIDQLIGWAKVGQEPEYPARASYYTLKAENADRMRDDILKVVDEVTPAAVRAELERLRSGARTLARTVVHMSRSMQAAAIEDQQNGADAAMQWILNSLPDVDDNPEDQHWDGKESAQEWLDRTESAVGSEAAGQ